MEALSLFLVESTPTSTRLAFVLGVVVPREAGHHRRRCAHCCRFARVEAVEGGGAPAGGAAAGGADLGVVLGGMGRSSGRKRCPRRRGRC